jgi:hypothetical protein
MALGTREACWSARSAALLSTAANISVYQVHPWLDNQLWFWPGHVMDFEFRCLSARLRIDRNLGDVNQMLRRIIRAGKRTAVELWRAFPRALNHTAVFLPVCPANYGA